MGVLTAKAAKPGLTISTGEVHPRVNAVELASLLSPKTHLAIQSLSSWAMGNLYSNLHPTPVRFLSLVCLQVHPLNVDCTRGHRVLWYPLSPYIWGPSHPRERSATRLIQNKGH